MIDLKLMWVWNDNNGKLKRWIVKEFNDGSCRAIAVGGDTTKQEVIQIIRSGKYPTMHWEHYSLIRD